MTDTKEGTCNSIHKARENEMMLSDRKGVGTIIGTKGGTITLNKGCHAMRE